MANFLHEMVQPFNIDILRRQEQGLSCRAVQKCCIMLTMKMHFVLNEEERELCTVLLQQSVCLSPHFLFRRVFIFVSEFKISTSNQSEWHVSLVVKLSSFTFQLKTSVALTCL